MNTFRPLIRRIHGQPVSDGAGVRLTRVIGQSALPDLDPFLLLDEFGTDKPDDYLAGFPAHPHRGFETVTYMLEGSMRHKDNQGHEGVIGPGDVQWMTAARGIVHSEMPEQTEGRMRGFQLWVNLPAAAKMNPPAYQEVSASSIPHVQPASGVEVIVIAGEVAGVSGPIQQEATQPVYWEVRLAPGVAWAAPLPPNHSAALYVFEGSVRVTGSDASLQAPQMGVLGMGLQLGVQAGPEGARLLVLAGKPLQEPVVRHGPFVMNTRQEIMQAFVDYQQGRF